MTTLTYQILDIVMKCTVCGIQIYTEYYLSSRITKFYFTEEVYTSQHAILINEVLTYSSTDIKCQQWSHLMRVHLSFHAVVWTTLHYHDLDLLVVLVLSILLVQKLIQGCNMNINTMMANWPLAMLKKGII